jgi:hypothetical protein
MEEDAKRAIGALQAQIWQLQVEVAALRLGLATLARNHHDLPALLKDVDKDVESTIANYLTTSLPEAIVDKARTDLEGMRSYLRTLVEQQAEEEEPD